MKILLITDTQFGMCDDNLSSEKWSKIAKSWSLPDIGIEKEKRNLLLIKKLNLPYLQYMNVKDYCI